MSPRGLDQAVSSGSKRLVPIKKRAKNPPQTKQS